MFLNKHLISFFENSKKEKLDIAVTFIKNTTGSTFAKEGSIMLVNSKEEFAGILGSNFLQEKIKENSKLALISKENQHFESIPKDPSSGHGNSKYETLAFFYEDEYKGIEKFLKRAFSLLIFGSGAHVSPLISMANLMGWETTVIDTKLKKDYVSEANRLIQLENLEDILTMDLSTFDGAVILSHNPKTDDTYLESLLKTNMQYIGLMGNKQNAQRKKEQFSIENDKRFFAPIGLNIGSYTPESIALSICAQIEARKNKKI